MKSHIINNFICLLLHFFLINSTHSVLNERKLIPRSMNKVLFGERSLPGPYHLQSLEQNVGNPRESTLPFPPMEEMSDLIIQFRKPRNLLPLFDPKPLLYTAHHLERMPCRAMF